jgi:hypothetical protein
MQDDKFNELIQFVVKPIGDGLLKHYGGLEWAQGWDANLRAEYDSIRAAVRAKMNMATDDPHQRIDRHKVAASFANAILNTKPIVFHAGTHLTSRGHRLVNQALAFLVGVGIILRFIRARYKDRPEYLKLLGDTVEFPPANEVNYPEHVYKALYHAHTNGTADDFLLSNLFFLIESYHIRCKGLPPNVSIPPESKDTVQGL